MTTRTGQAVEHPVGAAPTLRRRRSSRRMLLAVVLAVLGALLGGFAYRAAVSRDGVVGLARALPVDSVVQMTDLREVALPPDTG